jgi:hypothetical protein
MSEWISVDDRLPEHVGNVLVVTKHGVELGWINLSQTTWTSCDCHLNPRYDVSVSHWQPLPEPPK